MNYETVFKKIEALTKTNQSALKNLKFEIEDAYITISKNFDDTIHVCVSAYSSNHSDIVLQWDKEHLSLDTLDKIISSVIFCYEETKIKHKQAEARNNAFADGFKHGKQCGAEAIIREIQNISEDATNVYDLQMSIYKLWEKIEINKTYFDDEI